MTKSFHMVLFLNQFKSQVCQNKTLVVSVIIYLEQPVSKFTFVGCCQGISHWCLNPLPNSEGSNASQERFQQKNDSFNTWTHVSSTTGWLEVISEKCEIKSCRNFCVLYLHPSEREVLKAEVVTMHFRLEHNHRLTPWVQYLILSAHSSN